LHIRSGHFREDCKGNPEYNQANSYPS